MPGTNHCGLHETAILIGADETEAFSRLSRSPLGDDCQHCHVCRAARDYVARRLEERAGRVLPPEQNGEAAWKSLTESVAHARATMRPPSRPTE